MTKYEVIIQDSQNSNKKSVTIKMKGKYKNNLVFLNSIISCDLDSLNQSPKSTYRNNVTIVRERLSGHNSVKDNKVTDEMNESSKKENSDIRDKDRSRISQSQSNQTIHTVQTLQTQSNNQPVKLMSNNPSQNSSAQKTKIPLPQVEYELKENQNKDGRCVSTTPLIIKEIKDVKMTNTNSKDIKIDLSKQEVSLEKKIVKEVKPAIEKVTIVSEPKIKKEVIREANNFSEIQNEINTTNHQENTKVVIKQQIVNKDNDYNNKSGQLIFKDRNEKDFIVNLKTNSIANPQNHPPKPYKLVDIEPPKKIIVPNDDQKTQTTAPSLGSSTAIKQKESSSNNIGVLNLNNKSRNQKTFLQDPRIYQSNISSKF